jgi:hypothetical protein
MNTLRIAMLGIVAVLLVTGCQSTVPDELKDIRVAAESHPKARLSAYKTYAWGAAAAVIHDPEKEWSPSSLDIGQEIKFLVDRELDRIGLVRVVDDPDVLLAYAVGVDMANLDYVKSAEGGEGQMENVPKGGLLVMMIDPESERAVWVGGATADLKEKPAAELVKKRLNYAITEMFEDFPKSK